MKDLSSLTYGLSLHGPSTNRINAHFPSSVRQSTTRLQRCCQIRQQQ